jgi:hypothetical protein
MTLVGRLRELAARAVFASFGFIVGAALLLDGRSGGPFGDHPIWRTVICGFFGAVTTLIIWMLAVEVFHPAWSSLGGAVGAALGWSGSRWAKYVECT